MSTVLGLARYPRVFVKISHSWSISRQPYPWLGAQEYVKRLHAVCGSQRLMWASDWPVHPKLRRAVKHRLAAPDAPKMQRQQETEAVDPELSVALLAGMRTARR